MKDSHRYILDSTMELLQDKDITAHIGDSDVICSVHMVFMPDGLVFHSQSSTKAGKLLAHLTAEMADFLKPVIGAISAAEGAPELLDAEDLEAFADKLASFQQSRKEQKH